MVEKIPVRPESVRGLGNIISPAKTLEDFSVFNSSLSYVDGFYTMEYSTTSVRVELTASASSITVGESLTLTATVSDGGTAVEGASVSFTSGNLAIGTAVTGSDGVATLTVSTLEAGSYSITATYDEVVSSAVTVTVSYGFTSVTVTSDKSILSYADSESATLTAQLKNGDASASVSGETVDFYKYVDGTNDVLLGSGVTDSNGEATYSYSSQGVGDIQVYAKVRTLVSKRYDIIDAHYYDATNYSSSRSSLNIGLPTGDFEISFKAKPTSRTGSYCALNIGTDSNHRVYFGQGNPNGNCTLYIKNSTSSPLYNQSTSSVTTLNEWNLITLQYVDGLWKLLFNDESLSYSYSSVPHTKIFSNDCSSNNIKDLIIKPL